MAQGLHPDHIAGVQLGEQAHHDAQDDQIDQVLGEELNVHLVLAADLEAPLAQAGALLAEASQTHHIGPEAASEGRAEH